MKDGDKHTVQHNVQDGGDHQENERAARIPVCPQDAVGDIVEQLENNSAAVDQKYAILSKRISSGACKKPKITGRAARKQAAVKNILAITAIR